MSTAGLFLLLALAVGDVTFIVWPLLAESARSAPAEPKRKPSALAELRADHEAILVTLRDLDFDYQTGKLTEDDYRPQREALVTSGVAALRQIDSLESDEIEAAVSARRSAPARRSHEDRIEAAVAAKRRQTRVK